MVILTVEMILKQKDIKILTTNSSRTTTDCFHALILWHLLKCEELDTLEVRTPRIVLVYRNAFETWAVVTL